MSIFDDFARPFLEEQIHWRAGATNAKQLGVKPWQATSGIALAYLDARDVMERLDDVVGGENWQDRYPYAGCCELSVRINGEWITKSDSAGETDVEGIKGQSSTAFKRAAVKFKIGRYLYDLPTTWVDLKNGKVINPPKLPAWAVAQKYTEEQKAVYDRTLLANSPIDFFIMTQGMPTSLQTALHNSFPKGEITKMKNLVRENEAKGAEMFREYMEGISLAIKEEDENSLKELVEELGDDGKKLVWRNLSPDQKNVAKHMMEGQ